LIVFTITNTVTDEVFVGTTKDSAEARWEQFVAAHTQDLKVKLYKDIRDFGVKAFEVDEYAVAFDRADLKDLFDEAMMQYDGISLVGVKTTAPKPVAAQTAKKVAKKAPAKRKTSARADTQHGEVISIPVPKAAKESISSGRTKNSAKEKLIKEAIELEKAEREAQDRMRQAQQANEMREIMARLDARGSTLKRR
jgi:hypothetical protein